MVRLKRDLVVFLADNIEFFQSFSTIKIYYDNGQHMITEAVHGAIDYALSKQATIYKMATPNNYRLFQLADFVCTLELTNIKYEKGESTSTDEKMFGTRATFRRNYFRHIRKLAFENTR
jgi:hypothetical protein